MFRRSLLVCTFAFAATLLASCGGGGGGGAAAPTTTTPPTTVPAAPGAPTLTVNSATAISLSWTAVTSATTYEVWRHTADDSAAAAKQGGDTAVSTTSFADTGLTASTQYFYWLKACNTAGCSAFSAPATATTSGTGQGGTPTPTTPTTSAVTSSSITVNWMLVTTATSYEVWRHTADMSGAATKLTTTNETAVSYVDNALAASTSYFYWVKACISADCSDFSDSVTVVTMAPPVGAPEGPGTLTLTPNSTTQITLTWIPSSTRGVTYDVFRQASGGSETNIHNILSPNAFLSVLTYVDSGLTESTSYTYRVVACIASLCSTSSTQTASTMSAPPPAAPGALSLTGEIANQIAIKLRHLIHP
ncbi:MAG: fibronectin type III domain-containing protein [Gammaproteobacteria bacterium]|nr:fibronectin type III domain-containing protein [Gammaproteobacteria bacterium]